MDDPKQNQPQNPPQPPPPVSGGTVVFQNPQQQSKPQVQQPSVPSAGVVKEQEPMPSSNTQEIIMPSEPEMKIAKEIQEIGAEANEKLQLTATQKADGIRFANEATPVETEPSATFSFPMTQAKAKALVLHKKVRDSLYWLAMLILRQFQMQEEKESKGKKKRG